MARRLRRERETQQCQSTQRGNFCDRENILHPRAHAQAARVHPGQKNDRADGQQVLRVQPDVVRPQRAEPKFVRAKCPQLPDPRGRREPATHSTPVKFAKAMATAAIVAV